MGMCAVSIWCSDLHEGNVGGLLCISAVDLAMIIGLRAIVF
jgi:hypothetical protein